MHDECSGSFSDGKQVADKVRMMGFSEQYMPAPIEMNCSECSNSFLMETFESKCDKCNMVYSVTPCHAFSSDNIMPAGINY